MWRRRAARTACLVHRRPFTTWRKEQLDKLLLLQRRSQEPAQLIETEKDLQPMWQAMERRVKNRPPPPSSNKDGRSGRMNVKKTEEDVWLEEGLYKHLDDEDSTKSK